MRRRAVAAVAALGLVAIGLIVFSGGGTKQRTAAGRAHTAGDAPLKPHPRVVIALAPGDIPPSDGGTTYAPPAACAVWTPTKVRRTVRDKRTAMRDRPMWCLHPE